jgi:hypothetical protein
LWKHLDFPAMRLGDLDGKGTLYDRRGKPLLEEGERILVEHKVDALALFDGKKAKGQPLLHNGQGETMLTLTDRRLYVMVDPSLGQARRVLHLPGAESWTKGVELFEVIQGHGRYYLILEWSELPKVRSPSQSKETSKILVRTSEDRALTLLVDRGTAAWIEKGWRESR